MGLEAHSERSFRPWHLVALVGLVLAAVFGGYEILERLILVDVVEPDALHNLHLARGILGSLILAAAVSAYLHHRLPSLSTTDAPLRAPKILDRDERRRQYAVWFVQMRWIAIALALGLIVVSVPVLQVLPRQAMVPLLGWWAVLLAANVAFTRWAERGSRYEAHIFAQGALDLVVLSGFLNASGGLENPLFNFYVFHVIIATILLPRRKAAATTLLACLLFLGVALGEYFHVLPHYTNRMFPHDATAAQPSVTDAGHGEHDHASFDIVFVLGRTLPFLVVLAVTARFSAALMDRVRRSEHELESAAGSALLERQRLESVVDAAGVGMMQVGPRGELRWFSRRIARWLDLDGGGLDAPCPLLDGPNGCDECIAMQTAATGRRLEGERREQHGDSGARHFHHITTPVVDERGNVTQVVEVIEDVTARKALEAEAMHAGKLSVLGRMAAGIAHEIGNPLSSLTTRLSLIERRPESDYVGESIPVLRQQLNRIGRIVRGISHFSRPPRQTWTVFELNSVVEEALAMVALDRRFRDITVVRRLAEPSPAVKGDRDQISQVALNLLLNAIEAMPDGGTLTIETARSDGEVTLVVADTGPGIGKEAQARLFEPFFSTKNEGTGLGLSISYSLVHAHGGNLRAEAAPGRGARFVVTLSATSAPATTTPADDATEASRA